MSKPRHLEWLIDVGSPVVTNEGKSVKILEFKHQPDEDILSEWARHFRQHYCPDHMIDDYRRGTKFTRSEYLTKLTFPDKTEAPGPSTRAGDFAEILVCDFLEYVLDFWVPRTRYLSKTVRNESTKGCDVMGFRFAGSKATIRDVLTLFESKAKLTSGCTGRLQIAVDDSGKDEIRRAESLNAVKRRLILEQNRVDAAKIERFQNPEDVPYTQEYGAVAVILTSEFDVDDLKLTVTSKHPAPGSLTLLVIHGADLMTLVHRLYEKAANEA